MLTVTWRSVFGVLILAAPILAFDSVSKPETVLGQLGHSHYGEPFDTGPREKPRILPGIGVAHFPITTKNPEVQQWFDQGNALLHSFWDYEAERAFRWCLKLEPDNAMAYWGLARASQLRGLGGAGRSADMIREALKRKGSVTERERLYIESMAAQLLPDPLRDQDPKGTDGYGERKRRANKILETLCVKYPDDMEARALLALNTMGDARYGVELIVREILAKQPDHPGAHHYRIHNWDYNEPEQALVSARRYGEIVPGIGHALHMPGHIFSIVGMWNEAAISMDAATRAEKKAMQDTMTFPFNNWNYGHNRNYLSYIQEQLGMARAAITGAKEMIDVPADPQSNNDGPFTSQSYGVNALARGLLKFEHWDELLDDKTVPWRENTMDKVNKAYFKARAYLATGDNESAEKQFTAYAALKADADKAGYPVANVYAVQAEELKGRLAVTRGETLAGLGFMAEAAQDEFDLQRQYADPPVYPEVVYNGLGEMYLKLKSPGLAAAAYEKALQLTKNDIFALSGLVRAYAAAGEKAKAEDAMSRLQFVAADADQNLAVLRRAVDTGIQAAPKDSSPGPQRNYLRTSLERFGPNHWEPFAAPALDVKDTSGKRVTLEQYRGKNVMLIFYLGQECAHCMQQLHAIGKKSDTWSQLDTVVLAVSSAAPEKNAQAKDKFGDLPMALLSDDRHQNAHRFHSYDDFEEMELHSTILIDKSGRVYWARTGGEPFGNTDFLEKTLVKMNERAAKEPAARAVASK